MIWKKKKSGDGDQPLTRSWRQIEQSAQRQIVTVLARKRRIYSLLRFAGISLGLVVLIFAAGYGTYLFNTRSRNVRLVLPGEPLRETVFQSDGVLTRKWFSSEFPLNPDTSLMELDIFDLKTRLESSGQIREATVTRRFPDRLEVRIEERVPILRARVGEAGGETREVLISNRGAVYTGSGYAKTRIDQLPYLGGVRFVRNASGIRPLEGIDTVARLLSAARSRFPGIYATWKVVSCEDFSGDTSAPNASILVKGPRVKEIVFAPERFDEQLFQLDRVLEYSADRRIKVLKRVDLSLGEQVAVQYFSDPLTVNIPKTLRY